MKTYPIYEAKFSGSADYPRCPTVQIAARSFDDAIRRFRQWDECDTGCCGSAGRLVNKEGFVPAQIDRTHIRLNPNLRATRLSYYNLD